MGDVLRLCASAIPNRERVIACVLRKQQQLGSECRAVVARHTAKTRRDAQPAAKPAIDTVSLQ